MATTIDPHSFKPVPSREIDIYSRIVFGKAYAAHGIVISIPQLNKMEKKFASYTSGLMAKCANRANKLNTTVHRTFTWAALSLISANVTLSSKMPMFGKRATMYLKDHFKSDLIDFYALKLQCKCIMQGRTDANEVALIWIQYRMLEEFLYVAKQDLMQTAETKRRKLVKNRCTCTLRSPINKEKRHKRCNSHHVALSSESQILAERVFEGLKAAASLRAHGVPDTFVQLYVETRALGEPSSALLCDEGV